MKNDSQTENSDTIFCAKSLVTLNRKEEEEKEEEEWFKFEQTNERQIEAKVKSGKVGTGALQGRVMGGEGKLWMYVCVCVW